MTGGKKGAILLNMEINAKQREEIKKLAERYGLVLVLLFGSQYQNKTFLNEESDIDLAVLAERKLGLSQSIRLNYEFGLIFGNEMIDLVDLKGASPLLSKEIMDNCRVLYEAKENIFNHFVLYTLQRYAESKPLLAMKQAAINVFLNTQYA